VASAKRPQLPTRRIASVADLERLEGNDERCIVHVEPEVELVRDNDAFLDRVIDLAKKRDLPVDLAGSVLGHAYYRLRDAGILVITAHQRKYDRVRGRHRHYKVVRDEIPQAIAAKGERVSSARLDQGEASVALIGKLIEEAMELHSADAAPETLEELADVLEVVRGLALSNGISWSELEAAANGKRSVRGGFEHQTVLLETAKPMPPRALDSTVIEGARKPVVALRDLGLMRVHGGTASVPFTSLLANESIFFDLIVEGRPVAVRIAIDTAGIRLQITETLAGDELSEWQLTLFDHNGAVD
jgi:predicted house-cleaning noncanonical NTP pyrophosphatase (MazG superfamily)